MEEHIENTMGTQKTIMPTNFPKGKRWVFLHVSIISLTALFLKLVCHHFWPELIYPFKKSVHTHCARFVHVGYSLHAQNQHNQGYKHVRAWPHTS
jgi:hypothetical protein